MPTPLSRTSCGQSLMGSKKTAITLFGGPADGLEAETEDSDFPLPGEEMILPLYMRRSFGALDDDRWFAIYIVNEDETADFDGWYKSDVRF